MILINVLHSRITSAAYVLLLLTATSFAQISETEKAAIDQAVPTEAPAQPQKTRKILIMNLNMRNKIEAKGHPSTIYGNYALERMGERTGAFQITVSNDTLMFKKENLSQFDALCFLNTAGVLCQDPELRANLLDFVSSGGGFIGIHAAAATFVQWPEYWQFPAFGQMLGAYEDGGHPWKPDETIYLKIEDKNHPLTEMFTEDIFPIQDEVFQFREPYTRDLLHILLTIDTQKTDMNPARRFLPERYRDQDFAMSWVRAYGKGRVFYTSLGHNAHIYWNQTILKHILSGIQFALGDLEADARTSSTLKSLGGEK
jgi:type 1 glutamine amidotransferase